MRKYLFCLLVIPFLLFSNNINNNKWENLLNSGIDYFNKGQYSFAITNFRKYILLNENSTNRAKAIFYLAQSYYFDNKIEQAILYFNELITKFKLSDFGIQSNFWLGLIHSNLSEWSVAREYYSKYLELSPQTDLKDRVILSIANCFYEENNLTEAKKELQKIINNEKSEKYEEASVLYSYILLQINENNEALNFLLKINSRINEEGTNSQYADRFWLYLAEAFLQFNDIESSFKLYKKIDNYRSGSPSSDIALLRMSEIEYKKGNLDISNEYILRLKNEYPDSIYNLVAMLNGVIILLKEGYYFKAIDEINENIKILDKKIGDKKTQKNLKELEKLYDLKYKNSLYLSESYYKTGERKRAYEVLSEIINNKNYKNIYDAQIRVLQIALELNNSNDFEKIWQKNQNILKDDIRAIVLRSDFLLRNGKYSEALELLSNINIDQNHEEYQNSLILKLKCYIGLKDYEKGASLIKNELGKIKKEYRFEVILTLITLYYNIEKYDQVIEYENLAYIYIKDVDKKFYRVNYIRLLNTIALSYLQLKNFDESIKNFQIIQSYRNEKNLSSIEKDFINRSNYYLGWINYKTSKYNEAISFFSQAGLTIEDRDLKYESLYMEAQTYWLLNKYKDAYQKFLTIYNNNKDNDLGVKALFYAAKSLQNDNDEKRAQDIFRDIYYKMGNNIYQPDSLFELIKFNLNNKNIIEANRLINEFGQKYSENELYKSALRLQLENFLVSERYSEVLSSSLFYIEKFKNDSNLDNIFYWAGISAIKNKDYETAELMLKNVIDLYKNSNFYENSLLNLIDIYKEEKYYKKELEYINYYVEKTGDSKKFLTRINTLKNLISGVSEDEAELIALKDQLDYKAMVELSSIWINKGKIDDARNILQKVITDKQDDLGGRANNLLGDIELNDSNYKNALLIYADTLRKFKSSEQTNGEALYKISYCYYKMERYDDSLKQIELFERRYPNHRLIENVRALKKLLK